MTLMIASTFGDAPSQANGVDLIEFRIDGPPTNEVVNSLPEKLAASPCPTIVTCRSIHEGGLFDGTEEERAEMYNAALSCATPPRYIDVEYETLIRHPLFLDALKLENTGVILSWHDIEGRPSDLLQRAAAMQDVPNVDIVKMVWRARSLRDNLEAFSLLQSRQQPMIAMCMGEYGLMSRALAPKFGGFAVYCAFEEHELTAPNQPTVRDLQDTYRFSEVNSDTKVYGVIGNNVEHSLGPVFHNNAFQLQKINAIYLPLHINKEWEQLKATTLELTNTESLNFCGASVTIPHKTNMMRLAEDQDDLCKAVGATNTIANDCGTLSATNTDVQAIKELVKDAKNALVLGSGGVARSALAALQVLQIPTSIAARNEESRNELCDAFQCCSLTDENNNLDLIINCTPVGMQGSESEHESPLDTLAPSVVLHEDVTVFDTVYTPKETPLIKQALSKGCHVIYGETMFTRQAELQQAYWVR